MSRLHHENACLLDFQSAPANLQRLFTAAARLMGGTAAGDRLGDVMLSQHWLPIAYLISSKLCMLVHVGQKQGTSPTYIPNTQAPMSSLPGHHSLRCAAINQYAIRRMRSKFFDRKFSISRHWKGTTSQRTSESLWMFQSLNLLPRHII